ncbi:hypothetical protein BCR41DRAFT_353978 [Lobosporangium transversale]|uniref:Secreted protein n=1 Tax=Lobosporangium transversale TaxID=64571 RepID=A0A1Y2GML0_9FUNG|nr:hypothetical protein BCR41DRAFT_353978 [Lobosporangium transversale]ORZ15517.1 hypothetical protein BCR41DRAFT_353978 [Lobosporangium transversale]|eukprot:XP_021881265.1 hypothetical protein BCR41DRAFT_353978 [Lobosporangium transversale]
MAMAMAMAMVMVCAVFRTGSRCLGIRFVLVFFQHVLEIETSRPFSSGSDLCTRVCDEHKGLYGAQAQHLNNMINSRECVNVPSKS